MSQKKQFSSSNSLTEKIYDFIEKKIIQGIEVEGLIERKVNRLGSYWYWIPQFVEGGAK